MDINIQNAKIELIQWLSTLEDATLIQKLLDFRKSETKDWWSEISDDEKKSIEQGLVDSKRNNTKSHSEAQKIYEKWL